MNRPGRLIEADCNHPQFEISLGGGHESAQPDPRESRTNKDVGDTPFPGRQTTETRIMGQLGLVRGRNIGRIRWVRIATWRGTKCSTTESLALCKIVDSCFLDRGINRAIRVISPVEHVTPAVGGRERRAGAGAVFLARRPPC